MTLVGQMSAGCDEASAFFFLAHAEAVPCCKFLHVPREHLRARVVRRGQNRHLESDVFNDSDVSVMVFMLFSEDFFRTVEKNGRAGSF